ncbi:MAG: low temperature requirement protein A, partial [Pseudonocardia sp.]|nr:low temperature requirement protein A [Pseudonocardia sp.]
MADDATAQGALRGIVLLALLWWAWCSYAWLGNEARADRGIVAGTVIVAMAAMFLVALSIPESFADRAGGWNAPLVLAACYAAVRFAHLICYYIAAAGNTALRRQLLLTALPVVPATALLVVGGLVGPPWQTLLWALALLVDYGGIAAVGVSGWQLRSPGHFAERHGLIVIIAIGESLVALGVGVAQQPISGPVAGGAVLGVVTACCLWWLYFRRVSDLAEHALAAQDGTARGRLGRDTYSYLHFPVVASVIFIALGLKKVLEYVSDTEAHDLADPLTGMPIIALFGGLAVYL